MKEESARRFRTAADERGPLCSDSRGRAARAVRQTEKTTTMSSIFAMSFSGYMRFYGDFLVQQWHDLTPVKYGILLIGIGIFGWFLMKSGTKSAGG